MSARIDHASSPHPVASLPDLFVVAFVGEPPAAAVEAQERALAEFVVRTRAPRAYLQLASLGAGEGGRTESIRATYTRLAQRHRKDIHTAALVLSQSGFGGAVVRGVLTGIGMAVRDVKIRAFGELDAALTWTNEERVSTRASPLPSDTGRQIRQLLRDTGHVLS